MHCFYFPLTVNIIVRSPINISILGIYNMELDNGFTNSFELFFIIHVFRPVPARILAGCKHNFYVNTRSEHYSPRVAGSIPTGGKLYVAFMKDPARIWQKNMNYKKKIDYKLNTK